MQLPGEPMCGREAPHRQCSVSSSLLITILVLAFAVCSSDIRVKCDHCSKAYSDPSSLRKHNVKVHHYPTRVGQRNHAESVNYRRDHPTVASTPSSVPTHTAGIATLPYTSTPSAPSFPPCEPMDNFNVPWYLTPAMSPSISIKMTMLGGKARLRSAAILQNRKSPYHLLTLRG